MDPRYVIVRTSIHIIPRLSLYEVQGKKSDLYYGENCENYHMPLDAIYHLLTLYIYMSIYHLSNFLLKYLVGL